MLAVGDTVGRYVVEAVIGEGGMGRVYRALDPSLGRRVALKVLVTEPGGDPAMRTEAMARMAREARAAAALTHPNVVAIHDVGEHEGAPFIAMELVSGSTLRALLGAPEVTTPQKLRWLVDVARGLSAAHRAGLVHRDIKPENVMVTTDGVVKVLDFGIARRDESDVVDASAPTQAQQLAQVTAEGLTLGTPAYMAPEQLDAAPLDARCDQYAWGVMAYELLAGALPWQGKRGTQLVAAILSGTVPPLADVVPDVDATVSEVVGRAMERDRAARFASMNEIIEALAPDGPAPRAALPVVARTDGAVTEGTSRPTTHESPEAAPAPRRRSRLVPLLGAGVALLAIAGVVGSRLLRRPPPVHDTLPSSNVPILGPLPSTTSLDPPDPWAPPPDGTLHMWSDVKDHGHRHHDLARFCRPFSEHFAKAYSGTDLNKAKEVWLETPTDGLPPAQVEFCRSDRTLAFGGAELVLDLAMPEAVSALSQMAHNADGIVRERHGEGSEPICPNSSRIPAEVPAPGARAQVSATDWGADPGWSCLGIHYGGWLHFQYWFEATPTLFTAYAEGLFSVEGRPWRATGVLRGSVVNGELQTTREVDVTWETIK